MHLVYILREPLGDELRYSLRSAAKNLDVETVTLVGDLPDWVKGVNHLPGNPTHDPYSNAYANILIAAKEIPGDFLLMNDDFFVLQKQTKPIPHWFERPLNQQAARAADPRSLRYKNLLLDTNRYLTEMGVAIPMSYGLHIPMPVNGKEILRISKQTWNGFTVSNPPAWRSLYGNLSPLVQGTQREDVKFHTLSQMPDELDFLSTDERTFHNFKPLLSEKFNRKCRWEK
ncbi:hypothetical protein SEA_CECE_215 [Microbacterium phage Cece]|nr:hypothetical protein SEA_CECE_215 [Microbacterium phage Cece]